MNPLDEAAAKMLADLEDAFAVRSTTWPSIHSIVPLGVEIEVPWRAYYPLVWKKYFQDGKRAYKDLSEEEQADFSALCAEVEVELFQKLEKASKCVPMFKGKRYWEFCLPPVHDLGILMSILQVLEKIGLCPFSGPHRTQITFGGLSITSYAYRVLMYLELRYGSKERMLQGTEIEGWAFKGQAGLYQKKKEDLQFGYEKGIEFRPLILPPSLEEFSQLVRDSASLGAELQLLEQDGKPSERLERFSDKLSLMLQSRGIPDERWDNPRVDIFPWKKFIQYFDEMKQSLPPLASFGIS